MQAHADSDFSSALKEEIPCNHGQQLSVDIVFWMTSHILTQNIVFWTTSQILTQNIVFWMTSQILTQNTDLKQIRPI